MVYKIIQTVHWKSGSGCPIRNQMEIEMVSNLGPMAFAILSHTAQQFTNASIIWLDVMKF